MMTVFERVPDLFVQVYDFQFQAWAREFQTRGRKCAIRFGRPRGAPALLDAEGRVIERGAWLVADLEDGRMVVKPASETDQELIEGHTRELSGFVLQ